MLKVRPLLETDYPAVRAIYQQGIETGYATLSTHAPDWQSWDVAHCRSCRLVAVDKELLVGWVALSPVSRREVYSGVAEVSIYIAQNARGAGVGTTLFQALVIESEREGFWTLQSGILEENTASIALHTRMGFRIVGIREKIGQLGGIWRNVVLMERRSTTVGIL